jgi:hypothetical protein
LRKWSTTSNLELQLRSGALAASARLIFPVCHLPLQCFPTCPGDKVCSDGNGTFRTVLSRLFGGAFPMNGLHRPDTPSYPLGMPAGHLQFLQESYRLWVEAFETIQLFPKLMLHPIIIWMFAAQGETQGLCQSGLGLMESSVRRVQSNRVALLPTLLFQMRQVRQTSFIPFSE